MNGKQLIMIIIMLLRKFSHSDAMSGYVSVPLTLWRGKVYKKALTGYRVSQKVQSLQIDECLSLWRLKGFRVTLSKSKWKMGVYKQSGDHDTLITFRCNAMLICPQNNVVSICFLVILKRILTASVSHFRSNQINPNMRALGWTHQKFSHPWILFSYKNMCWPYFQRYYIWLGYFVAITHLSCVTTTVVHTFDFLLPTVPSLTTYKTTTWVNVLC